MRTGRRAVRTIGTRAPSTIPAASAWARKLRFFASCPAQPQGRSTADLGVLATGRVIPLIRAASGSVALSKASGPSSIPPVICPRSAILQSAAALSSTGFSLSRSRPPTGWRPAACPSRCRPRGRWRSGRCRASVEVGEDVDRGVGDEQRLRVAGTSMTKTWLIRRSVTSPVAEAVTSRISSSVCRLPFIRVRPCPRGSRDGARGGGVAVAASTFSLVESNAVLGGDGADLRLRPTSTGSIRPTAAASTAPAARSRRGMGDDSHRRRAIARSIRRSYLIGPASCRALSPPRSGRLHRPRCAGRRSQARSRGRTARPLGRAVR